MEVWVARNRDGELYMFTHRPILCSNTYFIAQADTNIIRLDNSMFPDIKIDNSPKKIKIKIVEDGTEQL